MQTDWAIPLAYERMFPLARQDYTDKSHYLKLNLAITYGETSVPRGNWPQRSPTSLKYMIACMCEQ